MTTTTKQTNFLQGIRLPGSSTKSGHFIWHFLEMMLSMEVGGILFQLLAGLLPESSSFAPALQPKAFWYTTGTALGMTITMVGWMVVRDHGWRHSLEMAVAMLAPVALVAVVCLLAGPASLPWYAGLNCPVMCLGMLALMLYRKDHFTGQAGHSTHDHSAPASHPAASQSSVGRVIWRFLEFQIPMCLGALVCFLVIRLIPASSSFATVYHPGTFLFTLGDVLYLAVPVVGWMIWRGHGWRHSLEMAAAMLTPVAAIIVVGELSGSAYRLWLLTAGYPAMALGMFVYMLYRREHFTGQADHSTHAPSSDEAPCH